LKNAFNFSRKGDIMNKKTSVAMFGLLCLLGLWLLVGCSKKEETNEAPASAPATTAAPAPAATPIDPSTVASVSGTVKFDGAAPKASKIDMSQDAACKGTNTAETVVVDGGDVANVFVYVKDGLGDRTFAVPTQAVTIDQQGCKYHPHVLGVMTGQNIEIKNDDQTTHNIHPTPQANREWNESQPPAAAPLEKSFAREEIMLPVKCNQHPWMRMYINVVKSPFYAVTGPDGKYEIKGLPPGDYTIAFVQEKLGEQDQKVTLAAKDSKTVDQSFKAQ
jgi:plastocyanin